MTESRFSSGTRQASFHLEAIDPTTSCISAEVKFDVDDIEDLRAIVDPNATDEDLRNGYELEEEDIERIRRRFHVAFDSGGFPTFLRSHHPMDDLPYKAHTNRELVMMLRGIKPLAYFTDVYPPTPGFSNPERLFDRYVSEGRFVKREYVLLERAQGAGSSRVRGTHVILYALKGEEWRIDAFILLQETATKTGWDEGFERMLGSLLGYAEWQNDAFIEYSKRARPITR